jgi:ABC-type multidrug transport system ATPase subunit
MSDGLAIETHDLVKKYGKVRAVNQLNLRVPKEQITAFLGRNSAKIFDIETLAAQQ